MGRVNGHDGQNSGSDRRIMRKDFEHISGLQKYSFEAFVTGDSN